MSISFDVEVTDASITLGDSGRPFGWRRLVGNPQKCYAFKMKTDTREAFENFVSPEPNTGCWLWVGVVNRPNGYGLVAHNRRKKGAHRRAYEIYVGNIPKGAHILHRCDMPCCVNPDHLFAGSILENAHDKIAKGRDAKGERNGQSKLTEDDVRAIRGDARTLLAVAADYGVGATTISEVRSRKWWKHVV